MKCCSLQGVGRVAQAMRLDLLLAQAGDGLNITWTDVSVAGLLWADGILHTMVGLQWSLQALILGGLGCWHCLTASSGQCFSLIMSWSGMQRAFY